MKNSIIIFLSYFVFSCEIKEQNKIYEPYEGPIAEAYNVQSLFSDSAVVRVKLNTPLQYELQNNDREFPEGVSIEFFNNEGEIESTLNSNYAKFDAEKKLYNVKGNVIIKNVAKNEQLNAEELIWNPETEEIEVPDDVQVRIKTESEILVGKGLKAKQDFSTYKILQPTGIFSIEK